MTKAKFNGTCQVCGRKHAFNGSLAKHGYTVNYGFFNGTCHGSEHKPLEEDKTITEETIQMLNEKILDIQEIISNGCDNIKKVNPHNLFRNPSWLELQTEEVFKANLLRPENFDFKWKRAQKRMFYYYKNSIKQMKNDVESLNTLIELVHGKPLQERVIEEKSKPQREIFKSYGEAYNRKRKLEEEGFKVNMRRQRYGGFGLTYREIS